MIERYATWTEIEQMSIDDVDLLVIAVEDYLTAQAKARKRAASS